MSALAPTRSLLGLPAEIRLKIYDEVLLPVTGTWNPADGNIALPGLLLVSQQIYKEAAPIFRWKTPFHIKIERNGLDEASRFPFNYLQTGRKVMTHYIREVVLHLDWTIFEGYSLLPLDLYGMPTIQEDFFWFVPWLSPGRRMFLLSL
jgi:hypothetical protein